MLRWRHKFNTVIIVGYMRPMIFKLYKLTSPVAKYLPSPEKATEVIVFLQKSNI